MDEVLNRKLFRHRAQILHGKVQGLQLGGPPKSPFTLEGLQQSLASRISQPPAPLGFQPKGLGALFMDFGPGKVLGAGKKVLGAGKAGLEAYRAARASRNLPPSMYERIESGYEKVASRLPKSTGTALTGLGVVDILKGGKEIAEGIKDEDPSKVAGGAGDILFGGYLGGTGLKRFFTKKPLELTGKQNLGLFGTTIGLETAGAFGPKGAKAEERDLINSEIQNYEKQIGRSLTDEERKTATFNLQEIIKGEKAKPLQTSTAEDLKFATGTVDSIDIFKNVVNANTETANNIKNNPGPRSDEEIAATLEKEDRKVIAGKDIKKLADQKDAAGNADAKAFNKFYNEINELTGGDNNTSDLLMLKFAMGLLGGTTRQKGFAGFAEVLGKAGEQAVDSAILLAGKEKERRADLAAAFLKNKEKNSFANITTERTKYLVKDPNALYGQRVEERARFKDSGYDAVAVPVKDPQTGQYYPQWQPAPFDPTAIEIKGGTAKELDERRAMLQSLGGSYKMADVVTRLSEDVLGTPGAFKLFKEELLEGARAIVKSEFTPTKYDGDFDKAVNEEILRKGIYKQDPKTGEYKLTVSGEEAIKQKEKEIQDIIKKNIGKLGSSPAPDELRKLTEAARIEVNFAYNYANSLKAEDRLTEKNLEDAKKVSSIFGFMKSPRKVKENFRQLREDAAEKFEKEVIRYQYAGGNNTYIEDNYAYMPGIAQYKQKLSQAQRQEMIKQEREKVLGSIKGYQ